MRDSATVRAACLGRPRTRQRPQALPAQGAAPARGLRSARRVPRISEFFGIAIALYYQDHAPPHFHALYAGLEALVRIDTLEVIAGALPRRALALVLEWAALHRAELANDWDCARRGLPLASIPPLD